MIVSKIKLDFTAAGYEDAGEVLRYSQLNGTGLPDQIAKMILAETPTPLQAQAILVRAWGAIQKNARLSHPMTHKDG